MGRVRRTTHPQRDSDRAAIASTAPDGQAPPRDDTAAWREFIFKLVIVVLASLWIYAPAYHGDWLWDDDQSITANPVVQGPWSFYKFWVSPHGADYFPVAATGFWLQWHAFGPNPTGYHIVNIVLHILGALAFWRLLHVMKLPGAWLGGLLFAIHPICVESVAWVSELKNTLSQPLFLLAATSFVQFDDDRDATAATKHYALAVVFFLVAMLTKTAVVMFPVVILAYGWWKHGFALDRRGITALLLAGMSLGLTVVPQLVWMVAMRNDWSTWPLYIGCTAIAVLGPLSSVALAAKILSPAAVPGAETSAGEPTTLEHYVLYALPFFWISAVLGLATCYFQWSRAIGQEAIPVGGVDSRIAMAGMAIIHYLWKTIWPFDLLTIYPRWEVDPPKVWQFLPWPIIVAAGWWLWTRRGSADRPTWQRHMLFALAFFLLMLLPILGFITISYMRITWVADHFLYTPMLSLLAIAAAGLSAWFATLKANERPMALATGAILLTVLGYSSFRYAHVWANEEALWPHTIAGHPKVCHEGCGCWQAHNRLGAKKFNRGDIDAAHYHFQNSTRLRPDLGETHNNLGTTLSARANFLAQQGNQAAANKEMSLAIEQFAEACRVTPHVPAIQVNLANALAAAGRYAEAEEKYRDLLTAEPRNPAIINNYGVTLYRQGKKEPAIEQFRKALEIAPNLKDARESLAVALGEKPDTAAAQPKPPTGPQLDLKPPTSPTLGPAPLP
jgi:Flp pilus assembly protein TadD